MTLFRTFMRVRPFGGKRFAAKMIAALLVVILIPTLTSVLFYSASSQLVKKNARESSLQLVRQAADALSSIITTGTDASNVLYGDTKLQQAARNVAPTPEEAKNNNDYMGDLLNNYVASNSFVRTLYVLTEEGTSWGSGSFKLSKVYRQDVRDLKGVKQALSKDGEPAWGPLDYDPFSGIAERNDLVLPVARVVKDFDSLADIGYLLVNLDGRKIVDRLDQVHLGDTGAFFVVDEAGTIVIDGRLDLVGTKLADPSLLAWATASGDAEFEYVADGVRYYNVKQPISNGWSVVGSVPVHELTDELTRIRRMIGTSALGFALLAVAIGLLLARQVTKPIKQLTAQMKLAESGDFTVRTEVRSQDEIGHMSRQFNKMIKRIDELLREVQASQESKRQAELRAVTHRIHPHFLFNTLSTIKWLVRYDQSAKAYEALSALVLLLEANMGKKGNFVTLAEELDIVAKYMSILEIRYSLPLELRMSLAPGTESLRIPRMLIQPLVENAIFHGIVPKGEGGEVRIAAYDLGTAVRIVVSDDGVGLKPGTAATLRALGEDGGGTTGIGLPHVRESIRLHYPAGSGMSVGSGAAGGAEVVLHLVKAKDDPIPQEGG